MSGKKHLHILWTSGDPHTARMMVMMYATNSMLKGWWDEVTVIVWGAAAKLLAEDVDVQQQMKLSIQAGVRFSACVACARQLGVLPEFEELGVGLKPWGEPLTELLQSGGAVLTV